MGCWCDQARMTTGPSSCSSRTSPLLRRRLAAEAPAIATRAADGAGPAQGRAVGGDPDCPGPKPGSSPDHHAARAPERRDVASVADEERNGSPVIRLLEHLADPGDGGWDAALAGMEPPGSPNSGHPHTTCWARSP